MHAHDFAISQLHNKVLGKDWLVSSFVDGAIKLNAHAQLCRLVYGVPRSWETCYQVFEGDSG